MLLSTQPKTPIQDTLLSSCYVYSPIQRAKGMIVGVLLRKHPLSSLSYTDRKSFHAPLQQTVFFKNGCHAISHPSCTSPSVALPPLSESVGTHVSSPWKWLLWLFPSKEWQSEAMWFPKRVIKDNVASTWFSETTLEFLTTLHIVWQP